MQFLSRTRPFDTCGGGARAWVFPYGCEMCVCDWGFFFLLLRGVVRANQRIAFVLILYGLPATRPKLPYQKQILLLDLMVTYHATC